MAFDDLSLVHVGDRDEGIGTFMGDLKKQKEHVRRVLQPVKEQLLQAANKMEEGKQSVRGH